MKLPTTAVRTRIRERPPHTAAGRTGHGARVTARLVYRALLAVMLTAGAAAVLAPVAGCHRQHGAAKHATYHCPMHPTIVDDKPSDCPICGMRLEPIGGATQESASSPVPGQAAVTIAPEARQRMGLTLGTAERRALSRTIRTSARIVPDETRLFRVTTRVEGWVDRLYVATTGQSVRQGDPLLTLYSPQLVAAQQELLTALEAVRRLSRAGPDTAADAQRLLDAARQRLRLWDVPTNRIARLETSGQVEQSLTLDTPASGIVLERSVLAGQKIMPGEVLMVVADLSTVWGEADLYSRDLPYVKPGTPISLTFPDQPDGVFTGTVSFVTPTVEAGTRTAVARVAIANPDGRLKPGMLAEASLALTGGPVLAVPEAAVLRTGERAYVFRDGEDNRLEPVAVELGVRADGYYEIRAGLDAGERIVVSANFLVDSESSMRAAIDALSGK